MRFFFSKKKEIKGEKKRSKRLILEKKIFAVLTFFQYFSFNF